MRLWLLAAVLSLTTFLGSCESKAVTVLLLILVKVIAINSFSHEMHSNECEGECLAAFIVEMNID